MKRRPSTLVLLPLVALGYAGLGLLGLLLAIPPGYASPVYPAAGLALVVVLRWGGRVLPGVWFGAFLANVLHAAFTGRLGGTSVAIAGWIGVGASLQSAAGAMLVARWQGDRWKRMEREQDAVLFLLLGGVLAGVVSASVSVAGIAWAGVIEGAQVAYTWWTWYVGDTLGILTFAPLAIALTSDGDPLWKDRRRRVVAPTLLALALVVLAFNQVSGWDLEMERTKLQEDGEMVGRLVSDRLIAHREILASVRNFAEATPDLSFAQFETFTRLTLRDNADIFALSLNDVVPREARARHEAEMSRRSPLGPWQVTERDAERRVVRAGDRDEYVAVRFIVPLAGNEPAVGFDIRSEPVRAAAVAGARETGGMAVTAPVRLVQERRERVGVLELLPVSRMLSPAPEGSRVAAAFAVAVIKVDEMIDIATRGRIPAGLSFQLSDPRVPGPGGLLYRSPGWPQGAQPGRETAAWGGPVPVGGNEWALSVVVDEQHRMTHRTWTAWALGAVGLLFAALFQVLLIGTTGRAAIIQRKNEAVRASEERYMRLFHESPLPKWVYDAASLRFLMVNDRAVALYGWTHEEFLRMRLSDLFLPGEEPLPGAVPPSDRPLELRHVRRDGSVLDVLVRSSAIRFGDASARLEAVQDVTRERQVRARLLLADTVFENSGSSIVVTDPDAVVLSVNPTFTRMTGYAPAEVLGRPMRILSSGRHLREFFEEMWRRLAEDGQWQGEIWNRRKDGSPFLASLAIRAVRDDAGATTQYVGSFVDITAQRALEEKLDRSSRLAALGTLVAGVAHEVNNPLTGVMGAQGTALEIAGELDDLRTQPGGVEPGLLAANLKDLKETLSDAQVAGKRIAVIVRDLTLLGRPEAPQARVSVAGVVAEALRWLPERIADGSEIRVVDDGVPDVKGSAGQLAQVLVNLLTNAVKAGHPGRKAHVLVHISCKSEGRVRIEVTDDGCGMEPEVVARVFDPFFTTRKAGEGTGLGLPICHSIVAAHGGSMSVTSVPGQGSTFRVELPEAPPA